MIGRDAELDALDDWVRSEQPVLAVHGVYGIGKSTLVRSWAGRVEHDTLVVGLGGISSLDAILEAMALLVPGGDLGLEEAMRQAPGGVWIFDDADRVLGLLPPLIEHWQEGGVAWRFIIASRAPLQLRGARRMALGPLGERAARDLLHLTGDEESLNVAGATGEMRLLEQLEGHPLAITLVARRLRLVSVDEALAHFTARRDTQYSRMRALDDAFALSWANLDHEERRVLAGCCVFASTFDLQALEDVVFERHDDDERFERLLDLGLVRRSGDLFSVVRAVRPSVLAQAARHLDVLRDRHASHFAALAGGYTEHASARLLDALPDILVAHDHSKDPRLSEFMDAMVRRRASASTFATLPALDASTNASSRIELLRQSAASLAKAGHYVGAQAQLERAMLDVRETGEESSELEIELRTALIKICEKVGNLSALAHGAEELGHLEAARGRARRAAKAYHRAARAFAQLGHQERSRRVLEAFFALEHAPGDERYGRLVATATLDLADAVTASDPARAESLAASIWTSPFVQDAQLARASRVLGDLEMARGHAARAVEHYARTFALDPQSVATRYHDALWVGGDEREAERVLLHAAGFGVAARLSLACWAREDDADALRHAEQALHDARGSDEIGAARLLAALATLPHGPEGLASALVALELEELTPFAAATLRNLRGDAPVETSEWVASDGLSSWFAHVVGRATRHAENRRFAPEGIVAVEHTGAWVMTSQSRIHLGRKMLLRRLLMTLVEQHIASPGDALDTMEVFHRVWSDEPHTLEDAAMNRLRVAIRRLRALLGDQLVIVTDERGRYLIDPLSRLSVDEPA